MYFNAGESIINVHNVPPALPSPRLARQAPGPRQTTQRHIKSRRLACFRNNVQEMSKPKRRFIRPLLRSAASVTVRDEGPHSPSPPSSDAHTHTQPVQSLLLRRFGIKSRTKTQHILTANHRAKADIFLKEAERGRDAGGATDGAAAAC